MFRNKVEITLPFSTSNKLLTILHYGAPLVLATIVASCRLKRLIYTFLHGEFEKREMVLKAFLFHKSDERRSSLFSPDGEGCSGGLRTRLRKRRGMSEEGEQEEHFQCELKQH